MATYTEHIAQQGDTWYQLAEDAYGDSSRYIEIIKANPGVPIRGEIPAGSRIYVPIDQTTNTSTQTTSQSLPPWKR